MAKTHGEVYTSWKDRLSAFSKVCTLMQGTGQCRCSLKDRFPLAPNKVACSLCWLDLPNNTDDPPVENCPLCDRTTSMVQVGEGGLVCPVQLRLPVRPDAHEARGRPHP